MPNDVPSWDETAPTQLEPTWESTTDIQPSRSLGETQAGLNLGMLPRQASIPVEASSDVDAVGAAKALLPIAAGLVTGNALTAAVPKLAAPAQSVWQYVRNLGTVGGISGLASGATRQAVSMAAEDTTLGEAAKETLKEGAVGTVLGPVGGAILQKTAGGLASAAGRFGGAPGRRFASAMAGFNRPLWETAKEAEIRAANELIENITGMKVPRSLGESLGTSAVGVPYIELESALRNPSGALDPNARQEAYKAVAWAASRLVGHPAMTKEGVSKLAVMELERYIEKVGAPARAAIDDFAEQLTGSLQRAIQSQVAAAGNLVQPKESETAFSGMSKIKDRAAASLDTMDERFRELYGKYRANPELDNATADTSPLNEFKKQIEKHALKKTVRTEDVGYDAYGNPVAQVTEKTGIVKKSLPKGLQQFVAMIEEAGSTPQTIESLRNYRIMVNSSIKRPDMFPGVETHWKLELNKKLTGMIDDALGSVGASGLREELKAANAAYSQNIDRFKSAFNKGVIADVGIERGATPESLFTKLTGTSGQSYLNELKTLFGAEYDDALQIVRNTARSEMLRDATGVTGEVNVGKLFSMARQLPGEVFPELQQLAKIAAREAKLAGIKLPAAKEDSLSWMLANQQEADEFLGPAGKAAFQNAANLAAKREAALQNGLLASTAQKAAQTVKENEEWFIDKLVSRTFKSEDVARVMGILDSNTPARANLVREKFLEEVIKTASLNKFFDPGKLSSLLAPPSTGRVPSSGGELYNTARAVLPADTVDRLKKVGDLMTTVALAGRSMHSRSVSAALSDKMQGDAAFLIAKLFGIGQPVGVFHRGIHELSVIRYEILAAMLEGADDPLIKLIAKPITELTQQEAGILSEAIVATGKSLLDAKTQPDRQ